MLFPRLFAFAALSLVARGHEEDSCGCQVIVLTIEMPVRESTSLAPVIAHTVETPTTMVTVIRPTVPTTSSTISLTMPTPTALVLTSSTSSSTPFTISSSSSSSSSSSTSSSTSTSSTSSTSTSSTSLIPSPVTPTLTTSTSTTPTPTASTAKPTAEAAESSSISGESTFYGGNLEGGACSFSTYSLPAGLFGTAYSGEVWDSSAECGRCVQVTGPNGNSITAMIVDECPECDQGHLDLFQNAFTELGEISAGIISTSYVFVPCGITTPLVLHSKSGTSAYYFALQVVNANEGISSLDVSTDGGATWQSTSRADYNFFEQTSGFGTETVDVRLTSTSGETMVVSGVSVSSDAQTTATSNF